MIEDFSAFIAYLWPLLAAMFAVPLAMAIILLIVDPLREFVRGDRFTA